MIDTMKNQEKREKIPESSKTIFLFFTFGFLSYFLFSVIIASAEDLLERFHSPTGMIWLSLTIPYAVLPSIVPYFFDRLPPLFLVVVLFPLGIGGLVVIVLTKTVRLLYLGVALFGVVGSLAEVTAVSLTAYFDKITVTSYCIGTGFGYAIGPSYYTAMSSWFGISFKITISVAVILMVTIFLLCYLMLENRRQKTIMGYHTIEENPEMEYQKDDTKYGQNLTTVEKLRSTVVILPSVIEIFLGSLFHDLVLSGITTTIVFSDSPFMPSDHYKYYLIMSFSGLCLGRSYLGIAEYIRYGLSDKILIRHPWLLVVVTCLHVVLLTVDSLYRFIPNVWIILFLVFSLGFWSEAIYTNVNVILGEIEDTRVGELSMGLAVFGVGFGTLMGAVISGPVEQTLLKHCLKFTNETTLCLTRDS